MRQPLKTFPPFKSVDQALTKVYEVRAASGIKTATYGVPTAASSATDRMSTTDRLTEAVWVSMVVEATLNEAERACVTCAYDGAGERRATAYEALTRIYAAINRNPDLVRALFYREFNFGETFAKPLPRIAIDCDVSLSTVEKCARKVKSIVAELRRDIEVALRDAFEAHGWLAPRLKQAA